MCHTSKKLRFVLDSQVSFHILFYIHIVMFQGKLIDTRHREREQRKREAKKTQLYIWDDNGYYTLISFVLQLLRWLLFLQIHIPNEFCFDTFLIFLLYTFFLLPMNKYMKYRSIISGGWQRSSVSYHHFPVLIFF